MSDYESLKELLRLPPQALTYNDVIYIYWTALEAIEAQERLLDEFEIYIDNPYTSQEIRRRCADRYYSTSKQMAS